MSDSHDASSPPHLSGAYALARALAPTSEAAGRRVEGAYRQAAAPDGLVDRLRLYRALLEAPPEGEAPAPAEREADAVRVTADDPGSSPGQALRKRALARYLKRHLPLVFALLPPEQRALLMLCKVERLSCADAARVLGLTADQACARLGDACDALRAGLLENARPAERTLVRHDLSGAALQQTLQHFAAAALAAPPRSLKATLSAALREPEQGRAEAPADRPAARSEKNPRPTARLRRAMGALMLILATGLAGYAVVALLDQPPERDLVVLSARHEATGDPSVQAGTPAQAEQRVQETLGRRLTLPAIEGASFSGLHVAEVAPEVRVPVFLYTEADEAAEAEGASRPPVRIYAYTYALLERYDDRLHLADSLLRALEQPDTPSVHRAGGQSALLWRHRDDIFIAISPGDPAALRERLVF